MNTDRLHLVRTPNRCGAAMSLVEVHVRRWVIATGLKRCRNGSGNDQRVQRTQDGSPPTISVWRDGCKNAAGNAPRRLVVRFRSATRGKSLPRELFLKEQRNETLCDRT
jgi:hypothetical protein